MMPDEKKHTYQSTTLGLPPLRMVLVHAKNEAQNASLHPVPPPVESGATDDSALDKARAVRRIIRHLQAGEQ
jgi:hypothetical protein